MIAIRVEEGITSRNIKQLYNFEPPATRAEIQAAASQYVRKISGFANPSAANKAAFNHAVDEIAKSSAKLLAALVTNAEPKNREVEAAKAHEKARLRFGSSLHRAA